jgi:Pvc16 N-terminal domain
MANFHCIAATGLSIERMLNACFQEEDPIPDSPTRARAVLIRTEDLESIGSTGNLIQPPALSILMYRVDFNKAMRAGWSAVGSVNGRAYLPLDLHLLITPWAQNAEFELRILGKAMQCLEEHPSLTGPLLVEGAGWAPGDSIQLLMEEIPTETVMRTFDSLPHDYKLSVPYVARVVRLDGSTTSAPPDVATRVLGIRPPAG